MLRFNDVADRVLEYDPGCDLRLLQRAYVYSAKVHEGQERLSGEPYLVHPLEVAGILSELRLDPVTISAGLLHDTVEDTLTSVEEISQMFGEEVGFLVEGLTKIARIEFTSARERQAENFRKMLVAMSKDIRILLIKLADRLHNMRTVGHMQDDAAKRVAQETLDIYVPLAHRLGIYWMKCELEELAFRALYPKAADDLEKKLQGDRGQREKYIQEVISVISTKLGEVDLLGEVTGRLKDLASIHTKMETQGVSLEKIYDVIAFRIVLDHDAESVYKALGIIHATWPPVPGRFKDYVALPRQNGYQSLHTTVIGPYGERMEVQVRTKSMHQNAEFGIAAHWRYKEGESSINTTDHAKFSWLRQLIERQREVTDPHEFLDTLKVDLFPAEVFVFTPKGDVMNLPRGSTALDFAYAIHTEVGDCCSRAWVNSQHVPLRHVLIDGDTVEIDTDSESRPKKEWLEFVASGKARSRIRHSIRSDQNASSRELGRGILERELHRAGFSLVQLIGHGELDEIARQQVRGSINELFSAIGYGRVPAVRVVRALRPDWRPGTNRQGDRSRRLRKLFGRERKTTPSNTGIRVDGQEGGLVRFGRCCSPLYGDEVVGFVSRGRGVTVHQKDCRLVFELDPERRIDVQWDSQTTRPRRISIRVTSRDSQGLLAKVTKTIAAADINIGAARVMTHADRTATQKFDLWVTDLSTLTSVMKEIERIKGIVSVERVRS